MPSYSYALFLCAALAAVDAFAPCTSTTTTRQHAMTTAPPAPTIYHPSRLFMSEEGGDEAPAAEGEEAAAEEPVEEDPELKALKDEIAELEKTFGEKKSALEYALEQCEEYSKTGYARKVAEMENMRRVRSVSMNRSFGVRRDCRIQAFLSTVLLISTISLLFFNYRTLHQLVNRVPPLLS